MGELQTSTPLVRPPRPMLVRCRKNLRRGTCGGGSRNDAHKRAFLCSELFALSTVIHFVDLWRTQTTEMWGCTGQHGEEIRLQTPLHGLTTRWWRLCTRLGGQQ